jgi:hypothetical protein
MVSFLAMPNESFVRVCLGVGGRVRAIAYNTETEDRLFFNIEGWENFITSEDELQVGIWVCMKIPQSSLLLSWCVKTR